MPGCRWRVVFYSCFFWGIFDKIKWTISAPAILTLKRQPISKIYFKLYFRVKKIHAHAHIHTHIYTHACTQTDRNTHTHTRTHRSTLADIELLLLPHHNKERYQNTTLNTDRNTPTEETSLLLDNFMELFEQTICSPTRQSSQLTEMCSKQIDFETSQKYTFHT